MEILFMCGLCLVVALASDRRGEQILGAGCVALGVLVVLLGVSSGIGIILLLGAVLVLAGVTEWTVATDRHRADRYAPRILAEVVGVAAYLGLSWLILGLIQLGAWIASF